MSGGNPEVRLKRLGPCDGGCWWVQVMGVRTVMSGETTALFASALPSCAERPVSCSGVCCSVLYSVSSMLAGAELEQGDRKEG